MIEDFKKLSDDWPSPFVARNMIHEFTKGKYKPRSMNTFDGSGRGISRRIFLNMKVAYLKEDVINWMKGKQKK